MGHSVRRAVPFLVAIVIAYLAHWIVFEQDVFWQIHLGRELWNGAPVQATDSWSYTAFGAPFHNFEYLASLVDYLMSTLRPNYEGIGWLRSFLVGSWALALGLLVRRVTGDTRRRWLLVPALVGALYAIAWFRLQMRPDLWAAVFFAVWMCARQQGLPRKIENAVGVAILLAWANFHAGTVPVGIFVYVTTVWLDPADQSFRARLGWSVAAALTWFATPIGVNVFHPLLLWLKQSPSDFHNPDYDGFKWSHLDYRHGGYGFWVWLVYLGLAMAAFYRRRPKVAELVVAAVLTAAAFYRLRMIHYQVVFLLPFVARFVDDLVAEMRGARFALVAATATLWLFLLPDLSANISRPIGEGVSDLNTPVGSVAFLKAARPQGRLFNAYEFGGYVGDALPQYPLAQDGRELPFMGFRAELSEALKSVPRYQEFLFKYDINVALETLPTTRFGADGTLSDSSELLYPRDLWGLVHFDNISAVYVRRIPEHAALLRAHEYVRLKRGLPAGYASAPESERELSRCLASSPTNVYCLLGKASWHERRGEDAAALELATRAETVNRRDPTVYAFLMSLHEKHARLDEAARARRRFARLTGNSLGG